MISLRAPAKVNLTLHITGLREDGYHLLDSLVVFADIGDQIDIAEAPDLSLRVDGPEAAGVPSDSTNSILKAAELFRPEGHGAAVTLTKILPTASGIGGGSADAAAALRGLAQVWDGEMQTFLPEGPDPTRMSAAELQNVISRVAPLGADLPVCLFSKTARMQGIGEKLDFPDGVPSLNAVLVNPRIAVETPPVFKALTTKQNPPMTKPDTEADFIDWLCAQRNDLEPAAISLFPEIEQTLTAISNTSACRLARMSGSGATCFGLYETEAEASQAANMLSQSRPEWWVQKVLLGAQAQIS